MDIPRSTYYYKPQADQAKRKEDMDIRDRLEELALRFPRYGYPLCVNMGETPDHRIISVEGGEEKTK